MLDLSSFYKRTLRNTSFLSCTLREVDFVEADLSSANFSDSDLFGAVFDNTKLEKADFRTALNYSFNPGANAIKKAKFSLPGVIALLSGYDIVIE